MKMSRLTRDGTAEPVSRDQILRRERGQGNINFPCSADHEQDWQPYPVGPYSCYMCDHPHVHVALMPFATQKSRDGVGFLGPAQGFRLCRVDSGSHRDPCVHGFAGGECV